MQLYNVFFILLPALLSSPTQSLTMHKEHRHSLSEALQREIADAMVGVDKFMADAENKIIGCQNASLRSALHTLMKDTARNMLIAYRTGEEAALVESFDAFTEQLEHSRELWHSKRHRRGEGMPLRRRLEHWGVGNYSDPEDIGEPWLRVEGPYSEAWGVNHAPAVFDVCKRKFDPGMNLMLVDVTAPDGSCIDPSMCTTWQASLIVKNPGGKVLLDTAHTNYKDLTINLGVNCYTVNRYGHMCMTMQEFMDGKNFTMHQRPSAEKDVFSFAIDVEGKILAQCKEWGEECRRSFTLSQGGLKDKIVYALNNALSVANMKKAGTTWKKTSFADLIDEKDLKVMQDQGFCPGVTWKQWDLGAQAFGEAEKKEKGM